MSSSLTPSLLKNHHLDYCLCLPASEQISYPIFLQEGIIKEPQRWLAFLERAGHSYEAVVIISDRQVAKNYAKELRAALSKIGITTDLLTFPPGESSKSQRIKSRLETTLLKKKYGRKTLLLALGGGVTGDLVGFIAATYLRGIDYLQIPTSLLAMVDSSIGGKTGINHAAGKNLIGAFHHPKAVIIDPQTLATLPAEHLLGGFIEAFKIFLLQDRETFFSSLQQIGLLASLPLERVDNWQKLPITSWPIAPADSLARLATLPKEHFLPIIATAIKLKAEIIRADPEEKKGKRVLCNFGHTIGHALEHLSHYKLLHGIAVGLGIMVETEIASELGILPQSQKTMIHTILHHLGISKELLRSWDHDQIIEATYHDKKNRLGQPHYLLLEKIGKIFPNQDGYLHPVKDDVVKKALTTLLS